MTAMRRCASPVPTAFPSDRIRAVYERQNGTIMAACRGGVAIIEGDAVTAVYGEESGIVNTEILTVAETAAGEMLLGSDGDGIYVLTDGGKARRIGTDEGLGSEIVKGPPHRHGRGPWLRNRHAH